MKIIAFIHLFVLSLTLVNCNNNDLKSDLLEIESLVENNPDSALILLDQINYSEINKAYDKALYDLLITRALDKLHLPIKTDSLIASSSKYFQEINDKPHQMLADYCLGRTRFHNGSYASAINAFLRAIECARELENKLMEGLAARGIADIYSESYNNADELTFARNEYNCIKENGIQPYLNYSILDLARANHNSGNFNTSINLCEQLLDSAKIYDDDYLNNCALQLMGTCY